MPKTILGWVILAVVVFVIFRTVGAAQAGSATGHGVHNLGTFASAFFNGLG
jgi:hypothetical protein